MYDLYEKQGTILRKRFSYKRRTWYVRRLQRLALEGKGKWFLFVTHLLSAYRVEFVDGTFELQKIRTGVDEE